MHVQDFRRYTEVGNMHTIIGLLLQDCGITFLYKIAVESELAAVSCRKFRSMDFPCSMTSISSGKRQHLYRKV